MNRRAVSPLKDQIDRNTNMGRGSVIYLYTEVFSFLLICYNLSLVGVGPNINGKPKVILASPKDLTFIELLVLQLYIL